MPIVNECTIKFDGIESALSERLGRPPDFVELVQEYVSHDPTGLQGVMIAFLVENRTPKEIIYAYMRTTRVLWPFNFDTASVDEQVEWRESVDRFFEVHAPARKRPSGAQLRRDWEDAWRRTERRCWTDIRAGRM